jgi:TetR/AcrR family transcriptional regulator, mexJK operon transcriptional repressor
MSVQLEEREVSADLPRGRERILQVARTAFVELGYDAVSMQEIADAARLTKAAIYYHFRDKQELLQAVVIAEMGRLIRGVGEQLAPGPPLRAQLERVAIFALDAHRGDRSRLIHDARRYCGDERLHVLRAQIETPYGLLRDAFTSAQERGEIKAGNVDLWLTLFINMIEGQVKGTGMGPAIDLPPEDLARAIVDLLMDGIAHPPSAPR